MARSDDTGFAGLGAAGLIGRLIDDVRALLRNEIALARAETMQSAQRVLGGIGAIAIGGGVLLAGGLALVAALILGLAQFVATWLAALIVGAVLAGIGLSMVGAGRRRLDPSHLSLEHTQRSMQKNADTVAQAATGRTT